MPDKNISIIGTVGIPAKYGGFETLVEQLVENLARNYNLTVYCSSKSYSEKPSSYKHAKLKYINLKANGIQSIAYDIVSLIKSFRKSDTILILGVSGCIILPLMKLFSRKTIIVHIDGLEWKRDKWRSYAKWFLKLSEKFAVKNADIIIADNKVIEQYVKITYNVQPELIAYGADHTNKEELTGKVSREYPFLNEKYAFNVSRIEPENNLHIILEAFSHIPELNIVIVGNWDNSNYGRKLKLKFDAYNNIYLLDPIYNQNILNQVRSNCFLYIHGHSAGGTNPSLVEAMNLELPIIAFGVNYNIESTLKKARYFNSHADLIKLVRSLKKEEVDNIAKDMKSIANERYTWKVISEQYKCLFSLEN
jgi:glycosyltransferase involved in cell wall biosynthesis